MALERHKICAVAKLASSEEALQISSGLDEIDHAVRRCLALGTSDSPRAAPWSEGKDSEFRQILPNRTKYDRLLLPFRATVQRSWAVGSAFRLGENDSQCLISRYLLENP